MLARELTPRASERGLSLLEVLAAVVVLAIALIAIFRALDSQTRNTAALAERMFAHWAALNVLEEARLNGPPEESETETTAELGGIEWKLTIRRGPMPRGMIRLDVAATAEGRAGAVLVGFLPPEDPE